nr:hypothetical protein [Tsukamurella ocularis]
MEGEQPRAAGCAGRRPHPPRSPSPRARREAGPGRPRPPLTDLSSRAGRPRADPLLRCIRGGVRAAGGAELRGDRGLRRLRRAHRRPQAARPVRRVDPRRAHRRGRRRRP